METSPYEKLGRDIIKQWFNGQFSFDGFDIQDMAIKYKAIVEIPGGFNPEIHVDDEGCCDPGDPFYKRAQYIEESDEEYAATFARIPS